MEARLRSAAVIGCLAFLAACVPVPERRPPEATPEPYRPELEPPLPGGRMARAPQLPETPSRRPVERYACLVGEGENLSLIAARHEVTLAEIVRLNSIADPARVVPGTAVLLRPVGRSGWPEAAEVSVTVFKAERVVELRVGGRLVRACRAALGRDPESDKEVEGDGRTPVGEFYVCQRLPRGKYGPSLGLSYPDAEDAERGLSAGLISKAQHGAILDRISRKRKPPWTTELGGAICIHGRGAGRDWTLGCIALDDEDAAEIFALTPMGAKVRIIAGR